MKKVTFLLLLVSMFLTGCSSSTTASQKTNSSQETTAKVQKKTTEDKTASTTATQNISAEELSKWTYNSGDNSVKVLNSDQPNTIKATDFEQAHIDYGGLDNLNRTKTATAYLTRNNLGKSETRTEQTWRPTGWHNQPKNVNGERVFPQNRGHLIAYTMTFNLNKSGQAQQGQLGSIDNPYNLFTQTEFSNQKTMTETEQMVRTALAQNKKVIYQVTPIFRGNELMARGVWVQAISTDGSLKFNRYLWNVQNNIVFDYATGRSSLDTSFTVPAVANSYNNNRNYHKKYQKHHKYYRHHKRSSIKSVF